MPSDCSRRRDRRSDIRTARESRDRGIPTCASFGFSTEAVPYRVFYAFDPRRAAILLIAGDKTGDNRLYERMTPIADRLYDEHLEQLKREGLT